LIFSFILKTNRFNEADEFKFDDWDTFLGCIQEHLFRKDVKEDNKAADAGDDSDDETLWFQIPDAFRGQNYPDNKMNINEVHNILKEEIAAVKANELSSQVNLGSRVNASSVSRKSTIAKKDGDGADQMILKGYFLKKNWMGRSQMRLFCLYSNGEIKYFDNKDQKGSI